MFFSIYNESILMNILMNIQMRIDLRIMIKNTYYKETSNVEGCIIGNTGQFTTKRKETGT